MEIVEGRGSRCARATLLAALAVLLLPGTATAADSIYWSAQGSSSIRVGNLNGSGNPSTVFSAGGSGPSGVAIDPGGARIYWANQGSNTVRVGNLNGSGTPSTLFTEPGGSGPTGVAVNPETQAIYWANFFGQTIRVANLNGSGTPSTLFTEPGGSGPRGVAIDPAAGKIYWANSTASTIRVADLQGGNPSTLFTETLASNPAGVAIDPAAGKIYWANSKASTIRVGNLNGSGSPDTLFTEPPFSFPTGVAIDPGTGRIYWTTDSGDIRRGNLDGSGTPSTLHTDSLPNFTALLRSPLGTGDPDVSGEFEITDVKKQKRKGKARIFVTPPGAGLLELSAAAPRSGAQAAAQVKPRRKQAPNAGRLGEQLSCSEGLWAPDLLGAFLFRAPGSFAYQWRRDGADIPGATEATFIPTEPGAYTCRVTASNRAGSTSQTSTPRQVREPGGGSASQTATPRQRAGPKGVRLSVTPRGKKKKKLQRTGKAKLNIDITFNPEDGGEPQTISKKLKLKKKDKKKRR